MRKARGLFVNNFGSVWALAAACRAVFAPGGFGGVFFTSLLPRQGLSFGRVLLGFFNSQTWTPSPYRSGFATASTSPTLVTTSLKRKDGYEGSC